MLDELKEKIETETDIETDTKAEPTRAERFAKTSTAAKLSGRVNSATGFIKNKVGQMTGNIDLKTEGRNQQLLGKIHKLVGSAREARELVLKKALKTRADGAIILRKHSEKLLDQAIELIDDLKKTLR
jgi:uncharacterized protein YjbJ (UPF0337 family)